MDIDSWIQLAVLIVLLGGHAMVSSRKLGMIEQQNASMAKSIDKLWEAQDSRVCAAHAAELAVLREKVTALESRISQLSDYRRMDDPSC